MTTPADQARTAARLARQVEQAIAGCDMTLPQYRVLALLSEGSAAASALARRLAVSRPSITALVDGLVARDMIQRGSDPADRRRVTHVITDKGRAALADADAAAVARLDEVARFLDPADVALAADGLRAWQRALDGYREDLVART